MEIPQVFHEGLEGPKRFPMINYFENDIELIHSIVCDTLQTPPSPHSQDNLVSPDWFICKASSVLQPITHVRSVVLVKVQEWLHFLHYQPQAVE